MYDRLNELMASSNHSGQLDNMVQMGLGSETVAEVVAEWQRGGSTTVFQAAADTTHLIHETVIEVNGEIDGIAPVGTQPVVKLIGEPGKIAIAAIGEGPGPFFIGPAAFLDLAPVLAFLKVGTLNTDGEDLWDLGTMPASAAGLTAELQMVIVEIFEGTFPVKSGISTLTIQSFFPGACAVFLPRAGRPRGRSPPAPRRGSLVHARSGPGPRSPPHVYPRPLLGLRAAPAPPTLFLFTWHLSPLGSGASDSAGSQPGCCSASPRAATTRDRPAAARLLSPTVRRP